MVQGLHAPTPHQPAQLPLAGVADLVDQRSHREIAADFKLFFPFPVIHHLHYIAVGVGEEGGPVEQVIPPIPQGERAAGDDAGMALDTPFGVISEHFPVLRVWPPYFLHLPGAPVAAWPIDEIMAACVLYIYTVG